MFSLTNKYCYVVHMQQSLEGDHYRNDYNGTSLLQLNCLSTGCCWFLRRHLDKDNITYFRFYLLIMQCELTFYLTYIVVCFVLNIEMLNVFLKIEHSTRY